ncbi:MAG: serine/threonine-protein kinase [Archangium sp.]|nr:serine/threonine-protein kinase [Archangium sp.]MDP3575692.1 serine/threonine-protein kinase [Archangium sp.]
MRERLGKYELVTLMSVGGMAELQLASMPGPGGFRKAVAVKQVLPEFRDDPHFVQCFLEEARITAALTHPHLAQVFDLGEVDGELYLAMEFIAGVDLARIVRAGVSPRLPPGFVVRVARDIALALASAHGLSDPVTGESRGVVHRDINPRNVMVTFDGVVKVIDFGLARFRGRRVRTAVGTVRGTPQYMAPEQLLDQPLDARTDLYGLGVVMWELLAGRYFAAVGIQDVEARLNRGEPAPRVRTVVPEVPVELDEIIALCLSTDPEARFASARDLGRALERCGVELFDEGRLSEFLAERLPQTRSIVRRLVALAEQPDASTEAVKQELQALRKADLRPAPQAPVATSSIAHPDLPSVIVAPDAPPETPRLAEVNGFVVLIAACLVALLVGMGFQYFEEPALERSPAFTNPEVMKRARKALLAGDPLDARAIAVQCIGPQGKCAGLDTLLGEIDVALAQSPCGTEAQAKAIVDEASELAPEAAAARLLQCVAGKRLHPIAGAALQRLELWQPTE